MAKQKPVTTKRAPSSAHKQATRLLHQRRLWWFGVLAVGLVIIQLAYNIRHDGQPRILGYATSMSADSMLVDTNDYRLRAHLPQLHANSQLDRAAQAKADDMVQKNYWDHVSPNGTQPWAYFKAVGYNYAVAGENLAYGFTTSDQVVTAWMNSSEHRDNVLGNYQDVGFGVANGSNYQGGKNTVVVALYGQPMASGQPATTIPATSTPSSPQHVNGATTIITGNAPWATYASLALIGTSIFGFLVVHLETLKLGWRNAKRYAALHPAVDAAVLLSLLLIVVQAAGGFIR